MGYVLVACEQSQVVCKAFREQGHAAFSNDLERCYGNHPEWHIIGDAAQVVMGNNQFPLENGDSVVITNWDLIIAHPPCTMITHSSAVALSKGLHTLDDVRQGADFFMKMYQAPCSRIAIENPAPMKIANLPRYNQIIQPYQFGHPFSKRVCLWLKNLPMLIPMRGYYTEHVSWLNHCASTSQRRSRTFEGIAEAMAAQWGSLIDE